MTHRCPLPNSAPMSSFDAAVIFAHGAPDSRWGEPFFAMRDKLRERLGDIQVGLAFMEYAKPTLSDTVSELYEEGARRILLVPVFLSGGGHVLKDLPPMVEAETEARPDLELVPSGAIGEEPEVRQAMMDAVVRLAKGG